jgi:para-nitrobenzyl esterase
VQAPQVKVTGGAIEGLPAKNGIGCFKGIPFAAPPVATLRWKFSQPVIAWEGVRAAKEFGHSSEQNKIAAIAMGVAGGLDEDCLLSQCLGSVQGGAKDMTRISS